MGIIEKLLSFLPQNKWCGCDKETSTTKDYQFRVRAEDDGKNVYQLRQRKSCIDCEDAKFMILMQGGCDYDPNMSMHEQRVNLEGDETMGFISEEEMMKLLVEMRLSEALELSQD